MATYRTVATALGAIALGYAVAPASASSTVNCTKTPTAPACVAAGYIPSQPVAVAPAQAQQGYAQQGYVLPQGYAPPPGYVMAPGYPQQPYAGYPGYPGYYPPQVVHQPPQKPMKKGPFAHLERMPKYGEPLPDGWYWGDDRPEEPPEFPEPTVYEREEPVYEWVPGESDYSKMPNGTPLPHEVGHWGGLKTTAASARYGDPYGFEQTLSMMKDHIAQGQESGALTMIEANALNEHHETLQKHLDRSMQDNYIDWRERQYMILLLDKQKDRLTADLGDEERVVPDSEGSVSSTTSSGVLSAIIPAGIQVTTEPAPAPAPAAAPVSSTTLGSSVDPTADAVMIDPAAAATYDFTSTEVASARVQAAPAPSGAGAYPAADPAAKAPPPPAAKKGGGEQWLNW